MKKGQRLRAGYPPLVDEPLPAACPGEREQPRLALRVPDRLVALGRDDAPPVPPPGDDVGYRKPYVAVRSMFILLFPRLFLADHVRGGLFSELYVSELPKSEDEDILPSAAGVQKAQTASVSPVRKTEIVELLEVLCNHKRRYIVLKAFL